MDVRQRHEVASAPQVSYHGTPAHVMQTCLPGALLPSAVAASQRIALAISGTLRTAEFAVETLNAYVIASDVNIDAFCAWQRPPDQSSTSARSRASAVCLRQGASRCTLLASTHHSPPARASWRCGGGSSARSGWFARRACRTAP